MILYTLREAAFAEGTVDFQHKLISEYHAEVEERDKERILEEFRKPDSRIRCLISTVAFGLGIDIPDLRFIIHWGESDTISQYWQEVGRGGRDGDQAEAHLYHRQHQLALCQDDMQEFIRELSLSRCMRKAILKKLTLDGMETPVTATDPELCCVFCLTAIPSAVFDSDI